MIGFCSQNYLLIICCRAMQARHFPATQGGMFHPQRTHVVGQSGRCAEPGTGTPAGISSEQQNLLEAAK